MSKNKLKTALPTVLFISGIVGIFVSEGLLAHNVLKAHSVPVAIADNPDKDWKITFSNIRDRAAARWKYYIPAAVSTAATVGCLVASNRLTAKQIVGLSTAVASSAGLISKYRDKIVEFTNEDTLRNIDSAVANTQMQERKPVYIDTPGVITRGEHFNNTDEDGTFLFYDPFTNMKFRHTKLGVLGAKYYLNRNFALGGTAPLEMFYAFLGLELPDEYKPVCWDSYEMNEAGYNWIDIEIERSDIPDPETGEQYYILTYPEDPIYPRYE